VIGLWAWIFPELRNADQLTVAELMPEQDSRQLPALDSQ